MQIAIILCTFTLLEYLVHCVEVDMHRFKIVLEGFFVASRSSTVYLCTHDVIMMKIFSEIMRIHAGVGIDSKRADKQINAWFRS